VKSPWPDRVANPHLLQGKRRPETPVNIWRRSNGQIKVMALSNMYTAPERRDLRLPSSDSTSSPRKTTSENSCKNLRAIQRSDQKLWPFQTGTLVQSAESSASPSSDYTSSPKKTASINSCKNLGTIQRSDQKL